MIVCLDGNIGAGKSSMLNFLTQTYAAAAADLRCFKEPVSLWQNVGGTDLLAECYANNERAYFPTQAYIMSTMAQHYLSSYDDDAVKMNVFERSVYSTHKIFSQNYLNAQCISTTDYCILEQQFELFKLLTPFPDAFIYLRCPPETCWERINNRHEHVPLDYLKNIHQLYDSFFLGNNLRQQVILVDGSGPQESVQSLIKEVVEELMP